MSAHTLVYKSVSLSTVQTLTDMGFTAAEIAGALKVVVTPQDGDVLYALGGQVPTATLGHVIKQEETEAILEFPTSIQLVAQAGTVVTTVELDTIS